MPPTDDDAALVLAAREGDGEAFGLLFQRWSDRCFDVARRIVHDDGRAAEVTQDTFLVAWQQLGSLRDPAAFGGWVLRTSRNRALNRLEHERRAVPLADDAAPFALRTDGTDAAAPVDDAMTAVDHRELVAAATAVLGEREASVLDLHLRHGLSVPEIAEELGVTTNNAHQLLFRTKKRLTAGIRGWVLVRGGQRTCPALAVALEAAGIERFGRPALAVIDAHVEDCDDCEQRRTAALDPAAMFAGAPVLLLDGGLRASVVDGLRAAGVPVPAAASRSTTDAPPGFEQAAVPSPGAPSGPGGPGGPARRRRVLLAVAAALVLLVGAGALLVPDPDTEQVASQDVADPTTTVDRDAAPSSTGEGTPTSSEAATSIVPVPAPTPSPTTAAPSATTDPGPEGAPTTTPPAADQGTVPGGTLAPRPSTPTTSSPPATTTTRPPAPRVDSFTAVAATTPGGSCPSGQWATTLGWSTTGATSVRIAATSVPTVSGLPPDGTRAVCRPTPGAPPGGWTLTASGPGGTTTATA
jgi:RNA polymerase sigma factor (sigma-70 family)